MCRKFISSLFAAFFACVSSGVAQTPNPAPLPNANQILQRALANERKLADERERYECRVTTTAIETDSHGNTKKNDTEVKDQFFVNGIAIERTLQKNGKDLTPEETKKEDDRVMKETLKYSNQATAQKEENKQDQELEDFMEAMMLANGRREQINGRSVLFYDILPNPQFQARNLDQRLAQVMQGKISIDETTGEPIDINVKSVADWKIGGGLLANVHKGLWLHIHNHPKPTASGSPTSPKAQATCAPRSSSIPTSVSKKLRTIAICTRQQRRKSARRKWSSSIEPTS